MKQKLTVINYKHKLCCGTSQKVPAVQDHKTPSSQSTGHHGAIYQAILETTVFHAGLMVLRRLLK